jgi:predicted MPP superfamily phosphohydrolase
LSYAVRVEPVWLEVNRFVVPIHGLGSSFDGLKIVQLSDLHCGRQLPQHYLDETIAAALAERGDIIVVTGDFVHKGFRHVDRVASAVGQLEAPLGVYAVLGNHDHAIRNALGLRRHRDLATTITRALNQRGIRVLDNESITLKRQADSLHLAGVDDLWSRRCRVDRALDELDDHTPCVLLAHNPRTVERLEGRRCDLILAGHTHGGQIDWPGLGRVTLGKRGRQYAAGFYRHGHTHLYVNKGVGFGWRIRYGVRPEIAVFQLHRQS